MKRFLIVLCALFMAAALQAQEAALTGLWEAYQFDSPAGFAHHRVLRLHEDGTFERFELSSDPARPFVQEQGRYEVAEAQVILTPAGEAGLGTTVFSYSAENNRLTWEVVPSLAFSKGREVDPQQMLGTWQLFGPEDDQPDGQISLFADGTYFSDLNGPTERGPYFLIGSGMVHWPTEASTSALVGVPGVWTDIQVENGRMSYGGIIEGLRITGVRVPTLVDHLTWGRIKQSAYGFQD